MTSYLGNTEATQSAIVGGWLHTGDIGYQRRGKWYISDRAKVSPSFKYLSINANYQTSQELIKVRGWQVSPTELEACLLTHQNIMDAAVIGIDFQDGRGELPRAYVVVDQGSPIFVSDSEIQEYVLSRLAKFKALDGGIKRVESIPRSSSGKILKKILREEANLEIMEGSKARNEALPKVERENRRATNLIRGLRGTLRLRNKTQ